MRFLYLWLLAALLPTAQISYGQDSLNCSGRRTTFKSTALTGQYLCLAQCTTAPCTGATITFSVTGSNITAVTFTTKGQIEVVAGSQTALTYNSVTDQTSCTVQVRALASANNWGKGRLKATYGTTQGIPGCFCSGFKEIDAFKTIQQNDPIVGPPGPSPGANIYCGEDGEPLTFSIDPKFTRNVNDGIGVDTYNWVSSLAFTTPLGTGASATNPGRTYISGEASSITVQSPTGTSWGPYTLSVQRGTSCNGTYSGSGPGSQITIIRRPQRVRFATATGTGVTFSPATPFPTGGVATLQACIPSSANTPIVLTYPIDAGNTYTNPTSLAGFTVALSATPTTQTITLTPLTATSTGTYTVTSTPTAGNCGTGAASITINRQLSNNTINIVPNDSCLVRNRVYTFTIQNAPTANTFYNWSFPGTNWTIIGANNGSSVQASFSSPTGSAGTLTVTTSTSSNPPSVCTGSTSRTLTVGSNIVSGTRYIARITDLGLGDYRATVTTAAGGALPAGCSQENLRYVWSGVATSCYNGGVDPSGCGASARLINIPTGGACAGSTLRLSVTGIPAAGVAPTPCNVPPNTAQFCACNTKTCLTLRCFSHDTLLTTPISISRPGGEAEATYGSNSRLGSAEDGSDLPKGLSLSPNPTDGLLKVSFNGYAEGDEIGIFDTQGKQVMRQKASGYTTPIQLKGMPNGNYLVRYYFEGRSRSANFVKQ